MDARELVSPDITDDNFKWRFAMENMRPKLDIQGPGVGSLLYAMNPATSELGLKQMDSELNQQLAANENFDKRGDRALKFMEDRVQEDINRKKMMNVDAGHANSLLANYTQAIQSGDATSIAMAEDQIRRTFPNADAVMNKAKEQAALGNIQKGKYIELSSEIKSEWSNAKERNAYIAKVQNAIDDGLVTRKDGFELIGKANQTRDWETINKNTNLQAQANASAGRSVKKKENALVQQKYDELKAKYGKSISEAEAWDRAEEAAGVK
jgi:hypothetical protein